MVKMKKGSYASKEDYKKVIDNLYSRISEIKDKDHQIKEFDLMILKLNALCNQEERIVDYLNEG